MYSYVRRHKQTPYAYIAHGLRVKNLIRANQHNLLQLSNTLWKILLWFQVSVNTHKPGQEQTPICCVRFHLMTSSRKCWRWGCGRGVVAFCIERASSVFRSSPRQGNAINPWWLTSSNENIFRVTGPLCGELSGQFPAQRPVTLRSDVSFICALNKRLSKQSWDW